MNRNKIFPYMCLCLLLLIGLSACEERIDIRTDDSAPRLVIYGYLTTDTTQHAIRITRSTGYFSMSEPEGISRAAVSISGGGQVFILSEAPAQPGLYLTEAGVYGRVGETYTLQVVLDFDGDGQTEAYEAESYLPPAAIIDSVDVRTSLLSDHFLETLIWGRLPEGEHNYFSFHLYRNSVLVNDSLQGFSLAADEYLGAKEIVGLPVFYLNQERQSRHLSPGDTVTIQVEGVTKDYATFISNAQQEMRGSDPFFSGPPANIETNIHPLSPSPDIRISGFFTAYSKHRAMMVYQGVSK
jgi:hypothetical protein